MSQPFIFLSHSSADKPAAIELKRRILASPAAKQAGLKVWLDKDDLVPSPVQWQAQIEQAIAEATCFAVYLGSNGVINWVENEIRVAISRATADKTFVIVPIVDADAAGLKLLPPFAREYQAVRDPLNNEAALVALIAAAINPLSLTRPGVALVDRPFVGLQTMTEAEADLFFGREEEVRELVEMFGKDNLAAIVADSGSGKSSLAQAGFIPAFRGAVPSANQFRERDQRARHVVVMRPGNDPLEGLRLGVTRAAEQLGRSDEQRNFYRSKLDFANPNETAIQMQCGLAAGNTLTLLVVDQFEEALAGHREDQNRDFGDFLSALIARQDFCVLITIRQDYFNLLQRFRQLYSKLLANGGAQILRLKRISDKGLGEIVRRPLAKAGYRPDDPEVEALVSAIRKDMSDRAGDLTLVQATLDAVWRTRQAAGGLLEAYTNVGGVAGALANEAETTRGILNEEEQKYLLPIFVRLIRPGETAGATRRIAFLSEFPEPAQGLIQKLAGPETRGGERLAPLLFVGDHVEIAHEALITQWGWLQASLQRVWPDLRRLHRLIDKAALWVAADSSRKAQHLATGAERDEYNELCRDHPDWMSRDEGDFIAVSQKAFDDSEAAARKQADDRIKQNRRLRILAVSLGVGAVALIVALGFSAFTLEQVRTQSQKAEQRSALLAANVAKGFIDDGRIDQALLLLLSGSNLFDDKSAPDEVLIGLDNALRKKSLTETFELSHPVTAVEGRWGIYLFDTETKDILKLVDKIQPTLIYKGKAGDPPILQLSESADGKSLFVIRNDLAVETINVETGAIRKAGQLKAPRAGGEDGTPEFFLTPDGLAIRTAYRDVPQPDGVTFLQIIDAVSGAVFEGNSPILTPVMGSGRNGSTYLFDTEKPAAAYKVVRGPSRLTLQQAPLDDTLKAQLYYGGCASQLGKDAVANLKLIERLVNDTPGGHGQPKCGKFGDKLLVTTESTGSAGVIRDDFIVETPENTRNVREVVEQTSHSRLSQNNLGWVGLNPVGDLIGVISNRDVVVVGDDDGAILNYRHSSVPTAARFVGSDTLLVVEEDTGTIVAHDLRSGQGWRYLPMPAARPLLDDSAKFETQPLHFGNCADISNHVSKQRVLPDGSLIEFGQLDNQPAGANTSFLKVTSGQTSFRIGIPDLGCLQFSPDLHRLVLRGHDALLLYDVSEVLSSRSLAPAKATRLPMMKSPDSALFVGSTGDLVVSNYSDRVLRLHRDGDQWKTSEIFRSQNPITYAELDDSMDRLIVLESVGESEVYGYLYSLKARQKWTDLGWDYKWLNVASLPGGEIGVSKHGKWTDVYSFASFSNMVEQAKLALSPNCRPAQAGAYRSSPCWPSGFE